MYKNLQKILLKCVNKQDYNDELQAVTDFYVSDFDPTQPGIKLQLLTAHFETMKNDQGKVTFKENVEYLQSLSAAQHSLQLYSQVVVLVSLVLLMPATIATSECSFSCFRRIESYL